MKMELTRRWVAKEVKQQQQSELQRMTIGMETAGSCTQRTVCPSESFQGDGGAASACLLAQELSLTLYCEISRTPSG
ncbi:hypothetical protein BDV06DRAFT_113496 [Aspergillus oleicola]